MAPGSSRMAGRCQFLQYFLNTFLCKSVLRCLSLLTGFDIFLQKEIGAKVARKMLVKLTITIWFDTFIGRIIFIDNKILHV